MEYFLLFLLLVFLILGLPIAALSISLRTKRQVEGMESRLAELNRELERLRRLQTPTEGAAPTASPRPGPAPPPAPVSRETSVAPTPAQLGPETVPPVVSPAKPVLPRLTPPPLPTPVADAPEIAAPKPFPVPALKGLPPINWEQFIGVKLFAWLGGLALFLTVAYFVKYSFEHNLIPAQVRVALGFLTGIGLLVGGVLLQRREYAVTSQTLCGAGTVSLYASAFAGHAVYHFPLFGQVPTFLLMALITATAFLLAVRMDALVIAILGMLGGFLTPVLLSTGEDNPVGLFSYIALLDAGLLAVTVRRRWDFLGALAALGTILMQLAWAAKFFTVAKVEIALTVWLGFDLVFLGAFWVACRRDAGSNWLAGASAGLSLWTIAFAIGLLGYHGFGERPGMLAGFVFGADLCLLALTMLRPRLAPLQLGGGMLAFLALAAWTVGYLNEAFLNWGLGMFFLFALLHSAAPLVLRRFAPDTVLPAWMHLFAPLSLVLVLLPMFKLATISFLVWPVVLLVDAVAMVLAMLTMSVAAVIGVLLLTVLTLALWILRVPADLFPAPAALLIIGGFAVFFFLASWFVVQWIQRREETGDAGMPSWASLGPDATPDAIQAQIPALSAILPFTLLVLMTLRLPLPNPGGVFGLALVMVVLLLGLAVVLRIEVLPAIALGCALALEHAWHFSHLKTSEAPGWALAWYLLFAGVFTAFPFVFNRALRDKVIPWAAGALAAPAHFYLVHNLIGTRWPNDVMGLLPAGFALPMLACLWVVITRFPADHARRNAVLALFGGAALFFITLIFPIQFNREWITIGWALEGAALCWLFHRIPHPGLRLVGVGLLAVAFVRLALNPAVLEYHPRSATAIFNWYLYTYGIATVCFFLGSRLLAPPRHQVLNTDVPPLLRGLGAVMIFLLINIEIADYFTEAGRRTLTFQFSGNFARDMSYTIAWALYALVLLVFGLGKQSRPARYAGIGLLAVTLLKLFLHDLASLAQLYRVGALAGVAVVAILASFLYQKFLSSSLRNEPPPEPNKPDPPTAGPNEAWSRAKTWLVGNPKPAEPDDTRPKPPDD